MLKSTFKLPSSRTATRWVAAVAILALLGVSIAEAQRPSLGGLQTQINRINDQLEQGQFPQLNIDSTIQFGKTGECSIGILPNLTGLVEQDPTGFRLLGRDNQGCRLIFGPTMDCTVEVDPLGPPGLLLYDPFGIRICTRDPAIPPILRWGPTDDCSIGLDPDLPGLTERDPTGFRLLGRDGQGCRLIFGPTMDCTVEIDPLGPRGLLLYDPFGIRICTRDPSVPPILRWGPTDDCSIGLVPNLPGLTESDPTGFRLLGQNGEGCRLIFGRTMDCTVEVDPQGPDGLLLRDPRGIRILSPDPRTPPMLFFGPEDFCKFELGQGLILRDPFGLILAPPEPQLPAQLLFGETGECRIEASPKEGMRFHDVRGFFFEGTVFAQDFAQTSSRRFKEDIRPIEDALDKIDRLQGVYFKWKEHESNGASLGFIAEDVAEVLPELVSYDEDGKSARGLNYSNIVAIAIEGVKAQQGQIEELETRNAELEQELAEMRAMLKEIADKLDK